MPNTATYKDWLFVKVQRHWQDVKCYGNRIEYRICHVIYDIWLPSPGSYQIIGKGDALGNAEWSIIVDKENDGSNSLNSWWYKDYGLNSVMIKNPIQSGHSLLRSLGMEPETTLILKKQ